MKVLWVSLVKFPPLCEHLGEAAPAHCGWMYASAKAMLREMPDVQLGVMVYSYGSSYEKYVIDGIVYYLIPTRKIDRTSKKQIEACRWAITDFTPDLIHIHGTEHSLAKATCVANEKGARMVANIQGLAGPYMRYADGGLSLWDKLTNITPLDFYRGTFLLNAKRSFRHRAECENYVLTHITDIVGRTQWDHDHVMTINPRLRYHFMNETLRDSFCTLIFGDFDQVEDLVYTFEEGSNQPITEDMLEEMEKQEAGFDDQLVTRGRLQAACYVINAMGEETRGRLIQSFCVNQLKNYEALFMPGSAGEGLDQMERRFHWFWKTLSE